MSPVLVDEDGELVELGDGRASAMSVPFQSWDGGGIFQNRPVSYARVFATQTWVAIAVMRLLTWSLRTPLKVYRRDDDEGARTRLRPKDHPLARAVVSPWDRGCMADLVMGLLGPLCVHGNGLTDVIDGAGGKIRFDPIDWRTVVPITIDSADPYAEIVGWRIQTATGESEDRPSRTVMHLKWWSPLGRLGISPLRQLRTTITAEMAAVDWTINSLKQGVRPSGVVKFADAVLGLEATKRQQIFEDATANLRAAYAGEPNAGKLMTLPPGLDFESARHTTAVEAELVNQRDVNRTEVSALYMIPPTSIGILTHATYSNIEAQKQMAYTDGLAPPLILIEQMINAHVVEGLLREDDVFVEFDFGHILRGDRLKEIQALREAIGTGLMSPNEGRGVLNLARSDSPRADKLFMPSNNLSSIDDDTDLSDLSLSAQRIALAVKNGLMSREEGRRLLGIRGAPADDDTDDTNSEDAEHAAA